MLVSLCDNYFRIQDARNIICCVTGFVIGMGLGKRDNLLNNKYVVLISIVLSILLLFIKLSSFLPQILLIILLSSSLFIATRYFFELASETFIMKRIGGAFC